MNYQAAAPAANAVISAASLSFIDAGVEVLGFLGGYTNLENYDPARPLVEGQHYLRLTRDLVAGIRNEGAIILFTARANPGVYDWGFKDSTWRHGVATPALLMADLRKFTLKGLAEEAAQLHVQTGSLAVQTHRVFNWLENNL